MKLEDVIKKPIVTEKSTQGHQLNCYSFEVDRRAGKKEIARAVRDYFKVKVLRVWTVNQYGQKKKAIIKLAEGEKIDLFETGR